MSNIEITITRSAGDDRAVLVLIDTDFEPNASDGGPGLRVLVNDGEVYTGKELDLTSEHPAASRSIALDLTEIPYHHEGA